jgi:hypothetical protein
MSVIYGPVPSWRLGRSLGVDLISGEKVCSFDCIYCQLGKTCEKTVKRGVFVQTETIRTEFSDFLDAAGAVDIITFSGMGEPTLASKIKPERVWVNTPLRPCPVKPLGREALKEIKEIFERKGLDTISVYESEKIEVEPVNYEEMRRRQAR